MTRPVHVTVSAWGPRHHGIAHETVMPCLAGSSYLVVDGAKLGIPAPDAASLDAHRCHQAAVERAAFAAACAVGADWLPLCADHVVPRGYVAACVRALDHHALVVGTSVRALRDPFLAEARNLPVNAWRLHELVMRHLHPAVLRYFMTEPPQHAPANPHQTFFTDGDRAACRQLQLTVFAVRTEGLRPEDVAHGPLDARLLACCLDRGLPVMFVDELPSEISLVGLDDAEVTTFGSYPVTPEEVAGFARILQIAPGHARWALSQRAVYPGHGIELPVTLQEEPAMARVLASL